MKRFILLVLVLTLAAPQAPHLEAAVNEEVELQKAKVKKRKIKRTKILTASGYAQYNRLPWGHTSYVNTGGTYFWDTSKIDGDAGVSISVIKNTVVGGTISWQSPYVVTSSTMFGGRMLVQVTFASGDVEYMDLIVSDPESGEPTMEFTILQRLKPAAFMDGAYQDASTQWCSFKPSYFSDYVSSGKGFSVVKIFDTDQATETWQPIPEELDPSEFCEVGIDTRISVIPKGQGYDTFLQGAQCYVSKKRIVQSFSYRAGSPSFDITWKKPGKCKIVIMYGDKIRKFKFKVIDKVKNDPWPISSWGSTDDDDEGEWEYVGGSDENQ